MLQTSWYFLTSHNIGIKSPNSNWTSLPFCSRCCRGSLVCCFFCWIAPDALQLLSDRIVKTLDTPIVHSIADAGPVGGGEVGVVVVRIV